SAGHGIPHRWRSIAVALLIAVLGTGCGVLHLGGPAGPARPMVPARVAYTAEDGHAYAIPLGGGDAHRISQVVGQAPDATVGREGQVPRWPTWSPDAARLAFTRVLVTSNEMLVASQLWTAAPDGTDLKKIWESADEEPIYLSWSPDSSLIALLVQGDDDLALV